MGMMYVNNSKRRGVRVRGRAKVILRRRYSKSRRNPTLRYGEKATKVRSSAKARRSLAGKRTVKHRQPAALRRYWAKHRRGGTKKRKRNLTRSRKMAKRRRRRHGGKKRHTHRRRARKSTHRRRARRAKSHAPKRRRRRRSSHKRRRRARRSHKRSHRRRRRRSSHKRRRRARRSHKRSHRRRRRRTTMVLGPTAKTLRYGAVPNPRRRRRSRRRHRRSHRRSRRAHRRYRRSYRRNPGGWLLDLAKQAVPFLIGYFGAQIIANFIGPMIPGVSALGSLQAPVVAVGTVVLANYLTKKSAKLAEHRSGIMIGSMMAALNTTIAAFAPASVKSMLGLGDVYDRALGDYVQMQGVGDYVQMSGMGDYVQMSGVEQELGVDQELGIEEELGLDVGGAMPGNSLTRGVPSLPSTSAVPSMSYTQPIAGPGANYDDPSELYTGVFANPTM